MTIVRNTTYYYLWSKVTRRALLFCLFFLIVNRVCAQAPNISYPTPKVYTVGTPITALPPTNTGGAVPSYAYGAVGVFVGDGTQGHANGTGTSATFDTPQYIAIDAAGNFYVPDYNSKIIRKITPAGVVTLFAGVPGTVGRADGPVSSALFSGPVSAAFDSGGNMFIADMDGETIRKITPDGTVSTFAGSGILGYTDNVGTAATFNKPFGLAIDKNDNIYVAEVGNHTIRKITPGGAVSTLAGNGYSGQADGTGTAAQFNAPRYLAVDAAGNVYVSDGDNSAIRKVTPAGVVTTIAGGLPGVPPALSDIGTPGGLRITAAGNIYFASLTKNKIFEITSTGSLVTVAGSGAAGSANGVGTAATFNAPQDVEIDATGNLYVADQNNNQIRTVNATGYSINQAPPPGITFDARTGTFIGTPTAASPSTNYTVTAYNLLGSSSTVINITVNEPIGPPNIGYATPQIYTINIPIAPLFPINVGGPATSYGIDKPLIAGLNFDITTGKISGTPTAVSAPITYTITAYSAAGNGSTTISIEVDGSGGVTPTVINFPVPGTAAIGADGVLATNATSNNTDSRIIYASSDPSIAYVGADGLIHVIGAGSVDITASQNASTHFTAAAPVTRTFIIRQSQSITFPVIQSKGVCQPDFQVGATSTNSSAPISYTSSQPQVATVSATGAGASS